MSDARLTEALARLEQHHKLHLPLRRTDVLGRLALRFLWRRQLKWQLETNLAIRDAVVAISEGASGRQPELEERLEWLRRNDENMAAGLNQRLYSAIGHLQTQVSDLSMQLGERLENAGEIDQRIKSMEAQIVALTEEARSIRSRRAQLDLLLDELREARPEKPENSVIDSFGERDHFIELAVPELLDGPAERVRAARGSYLSVVTEARENSANGPVFDVAPARGEWLEALRAAGVPYQSASLNPLVRRHCAGLGCEVADADPLVLLGEAATRSLGAVTAFRYVERVDPAVLARFVDLAAVALQPGGVLIIETPTVASEDFHIDPYARRAVHPTYLRFLVEAAGFARCEVRDAQAEPPNHRVTALGTGESGTTSRYSLLAWR